MPGALQRIDTRPAELRAEARQQFGMGQQFIGDGARQSVELRLEVAMKENLPYHSYNMHYNTYAVNNILNPGCTPCGNECHQKTNNPMMGKTGFANASTMAASNRNYRSPRSRTR